VREAGTGMSVWRRAAAEDGRAGALHAMSGGCQTGAVTSIAAERRRQIRMDN